MEQDADSPAWLLLIHQLPAEPAYLRVKVWRRMQALGALPLKGSVYALPNSAASRSRLQALIPEIAKGGGEAFAIEARFVEGLSDEKVSALFCEARTAAYAGLAREIATICASARGKDALRRLAQAQRRFDQTAAVDFFGATGREEISMSLAETQARLAAAI